MSFRNIRQSTIAQADLTSAERAPWKRNASWPALTTPTGSDERAIGLFAVFPQSSFAAIRCTVSSGNFYVDWGDGTNSTTANTGIANHTYDYNDVNLDGTNAPVTLNATTDTVERTAHGYVDGDLVQLYNIVTTTGIDAGRQYYVVNATTNDFQISIEPNGTVVTFTGDGTAALLPYKIAIIEITPVTGGATFRSVDLAEAPSTPGGAPASGNNNGWLDLRANFTATSSSQLYLTNSTSCTWLEMLEFAVASLSSASSLFGQRANNLRWARITYRSNSNFNLTSLFAACKALTDVDIKFEGTGRPTSVSSLFSNCCNLQFAPFFDTAGCTDFSIMFAGCRALAVVPAYNTSAATAMQYMFAGCAALKTVPLFDTANVLNMSNMFGVVSSVPCGSLEAVPFFDTSSVTDFSLMFGNGNSGNGCSNLQEVPAFDLSSATTTSQMFVGCWSLRRVPDFDTGSATNMSQMFYRCYSLKSAPRMDTSSNTNFYRMFAECSALEYAPDYDTTALVGSSNSTGMYQFLNACVSLLETPAMNIGQGITGTNAYQYIVNSCKLTRIKFTGAKFTHIISNNMLGAAELDEYYTGLPTVTGQTLTVTGNYGTYGDDPSIATAKGWTVTGS